MSEQPTRPAGVSLRVLQASLPSGLGLDVLLVIALACIGVSVRRMAPDLVWAYAGVVLAVIWWAIGRAAAAPRKGAGQ